jgi:Domain of unknown function (DUF4360)
VLRHRFEQLSASPQSLQYHSFESFISLHLFAASPHSLIMKFSSAAFFLASATALTLPTQDGEDGANQFPNTVSIGNWGRDGASSSFSEFPAQDPYASYPYNANPYQANPYQSNPYQSNPYQANPYQANPYQSNPYQSNPYVAPAPPPPPVPAPNPYIAPVPNPNTPIVPVSAADVPTQVTIQQTGYSGNGCPAGTVSTLLSADKTVVTFGFDSFQATIGPGANPANKQKNCQLHLDLRYPSGYQLSIMTATYHGYVRLDQGVTANFISSYYFSQAAEKTVCAHFEIQSKVKLTLSRP